MKSLLRVALLALLAVPTATFAENPSRAPSAGVAAVLQPFVENHSLAGAVTLVADKDKVLSLDTVGYMDVAAKTPMRPDAMFWIASMTKPITGAAMMVLVDEGKVSIDDPVEKYLPEFKNLKVSAGKDKEPTPAKHPITIREILSHTSGLSFKSNAEAPTLDALPLKDAVKSYTTTPLDYEPGTSYKYSNAGINTAGRIIEVVSGMPYEEFLDKRLFAPLGMKDTTFWPSEEQVKRLAKSYKPNAKKDDLEDTTITALKYPLSERKNRYPMPGGGLFSTASDIGRFAQMVLNGGTLDGKKVLSEKSVNVMTSKQTPDAIKTGYGLGWSTDPVVGHGGAYATNMAIDRKKGLITVYMVQHNGFAGDGGKGLGVFRKAAIDKFAAGK